MKFWEVLKELTEDPMRVFEAELDSKGWRVRIEVDTVLSRYFNFEVFNGARLIDQSCNGGAFNGNVSMDLDWQLVRQPVTWQEAILEFSKGNKVHVKFNGQEWTLSVLIELPEYLNRAITIGKWYVED